MTEHDSAHQTVAWARQRLDEVDAIITSLESSAQQLREKAGDDVQAALARLQQSRAAIQGYSDSLRDEADVARQHTSETLVKIEAEWLEVESTFQSFLSTTRDHAETVRNVLAARAAAQRKSWENTLRGFGEQAQETAEKARKDFDDVYRRLSSEVEKVQARIGDARGAGDESWKALKAGLAEVRDVQSQTIQKIKTAFSTLF